LCEGRHGCRYEKKVENQQDGQPSFHGWAKRFPPINRTDALPLSP
jgi:hypothetical protein